MQLYQGIPRKLQIDPQADAKRSLPLYSLPLDVQDDFGAIKQPKPLQTLLSFMVLACREGNALVN
jgi:hypothetical protein